MHLHPKPLNWMAQFSSVLQNPFVDLGTNGHQVQVLVGFDDKKNCKNMYQRVSARQGLSPFIYKTL